VVFALIERRAVEPILPPWVFSRRVLVAGNLASIAIGAVLIGQTSYVPTYAQGVVGVGAVLAGFAMAAMSVGWPLASSQAAKLYLRIDFRNTALIGSVFVIGGCLMFALYVQEDTGLGRVALASFVTGVGLGFASIAILVAVQSVVGWNRRGVVTGANMFTRSVGSAVGVAVFGSIANTTLAEKFRHPPAALVARLPHSVNSATLAFSHRAGDRAVAAYTRHALYLATHRIFWALVVAAVFGMLLQMLMPKKAEPLVFAEDATGGAA